MRVIDVHTHMMSQQWLGMVQTQGAPKYEVKKTRAGQDTVFMNGAPFLTLQPEMFDFAKRIESMDKAGVDTAIVSLTCPSAFFGTEEVSLGASVHINDFFAKQQDTYGADRIRWFATLPWQFADVAIAELKRAVEIGAVGVFVTGNIDGENLTDPKFAPVWKAIDDLALPVLIHPTAPQGGEAMNIGEYGMVPPLGFTHDTSLAISRMIFDGFFEIFPNLKIIASHGGGTLPYLAGRLDRCFDRIPACSEKISKKPSHYLKHIYYDAVLYEQSALELCIEVAGGPEHVLFGSDYPHNIGDMEGVLSRVDALGGDRTCLVRGASAEAIFKL